MAGPSWLVDKSRIATKIKSASGASEKATWKSNPTRACPNCQHVIDNSDVAQEWPGLPKGVKFDPSDQEIVWHLLAKVGAGNSKPHPFIDEFITTLEVNDGICYTHPQQLPGVRQDGSASHFFHRAIKAYNTGSRKRRKIHGQEFGDVRWHKTGRTKPVILSGVQKGCKKIMVLYLNPGRGGKAEKTNWVMHQYHLGTEEDENDGEYVISKVFYQQQQVKLGEKDDHDVAETTEATIVKVDPVTPKSVTPEPPRNEKQCLDQLQEESDHTPQHPQLESFDDILADYEELATINPLVVEATIVKVDPVTPKSVTPEPPRNEKRCSDLDQGDESHHISQRPQLECIHDIQADYEEAAKNDPQQLVEALVVETQNIEGVDNNGDEDSWFVGSQNMLDTQQLMEALPLCDDLLQSQSPKRDGKNGEQNEQPSFSVYADLGPEHLKKDIEDCQNLVLDPANVELDTSTPPEFRLSQLEFSSQDSFIAWGGSIVIN